MQISHEARADARSPRPVTSYYIESPGYGGKRATRVNSRTWLGITHKNTGFLILFFINRWTRKTSSYATRTLPRNIFAVSLTRACFARNIGIGKQLLLLRLYIHVYKIYIKRERWPRCITPPWTALEKLHAHTSCIYYYICV